MSASSRWRTLSVLILLAVAVSGVGSYLTFYRHAGPQTTTVTPVVTTASSTQVTVRPPRPVDWITVGEVKPINYYLLLLESNGTQPYAQLAKDLRRLPDLTNATAVAKITYLALNATNPEVKEALELMILGGTPNPEDYGRVPNYNTELQVLYWLSCRNELKKDDTLALAIVSVNGLWVTMGDYFVSEAVKKDTTDLLAYFRETNELQRRRGFPLLEEYPLEGKICLAWTANNAAHFWSDTFSLTKLVKRSLGLSDYEWATVSTGTLREMRQLVERNGWLGTNFGTTVSNLEYYFYFSNHWNYTYTTWLRIDGRYVRAVGIHNVDWQFQYYLKNKQGIGTCGDEADLVDAHFRRSGEGLFTKTCFTKTISTDSHAHLIYVICLIES